MIGEGVKINDDFNALSASSSLITKKKANLNKNSNIVYCLPIPTYNNC